MKLAFQYGADVMRAVAIIVIVLIVIAVFVKIGWVKGVLITLSVLLTAFTLYFFRDPDRTVPAEALQHEGIIISPADGKVVVVEDIIDNEYHHGPAKQISVFLSPLNVHVNRIPLSGTVDYYKYIEGKYLVAFNDKASELNERTHIGVCSKGGIRVLFKQIAGAVARRIVCELKTGDTVHVGDRFGMIKFGSRMDLLVPPEMIVNVKVGDVVTAGETILCKMP